MTEQTLIIIKPDGIQRHLAGEMIGRFERKGFKLIAAKCVLISKQQAAALYSEHEGQPFYKGLLNYLSSSPSLITVWEAEDIITTARKMIGSTASRQAESGTIRGDLCCAPGYNLVHGSDSPESAKKEINLFFKPDELVQYEYTDSQWLYGSNI
ncbi:MAG: nucleoside-diphosphate kinase [Planctomycetota bacterium]|jgi:nucleoside-diphosphate kinase